jgi:hypothetical protein
MANAFLFAHLTASHVTFCLDTRRRRRLAGPGATPPAFPQTVRTYGEGVVHGGRAADVPRVPLIQDEGIRVIVDFDMTFSNDC